LKRSITAPGAAISPSGGRRFQLLQILVVEPLPPQAGIAPRAVGGVPAAQLGQARPARRSSAGTAARHWRPRPWLSPCRWPGHSPGHRLPSIPHQHETARPAAH